MAQRSAAALARPGWAWDLLAVLALLILPALVLKEAPGGLPPYGGDVVLHVYPLFSLLAAGLHAGRLALWNFYAAGGYPLAPYSALAFDPPVAAALLALPVTAAIAALYAFDLAMMGLGMYWLAADLGLSRPARLLAACTFAYGGFVAAHAYAGHLLELGAVCWLPVAYLLLRRAITRHSWAYAVWCGATIGLMVLAAGLQFLPFALAPLPALALWRLVVSSRAGALSLWRAAWPALALILAGLVAAALAAVLLLPFWELLGGTLRSAPVPYATATAQSLPSWQGLLLFAAPNALGNPAAGSYWPASRFSPYFHEIYAYAGLLPLLLAPVALARRRAALPYAALALLALLVMLGSHTPLYLAIYHLPGGGLFRAPARAGLVVDFALAIVAAFGLDALRDTARGLGRLLGPVALALLAVLAVLLAAANGGLGVPAAGRAAALAGAVRLAIALGLGLVVWAGLRWDRRLVGVLPALALLDLVTANGPLVSPTDPARYYSHVGAAGALPPGASSYRLWARDNAILPGLGMVTRRLYDVQDFAPLALRDYWQLSHPSEAARTGAQAVVTGRDTIRDTAPFFLNLFGVRTVFSDVALSDPALRPAGRVTTLRWTIPGGADWNMHPVRATSLVYRNSAALPRLFVATRAITIDDPAAALAALQRGAVDPRRTVLLSRSPAPATGLAASAQRAWAAWLAAAPENALSTSADGGPRGGYLVIDDGWYPGWTATVDGHDAPVRRADYLLRAVYLPPGRHTVRLVYAPLTYLLGALITLVTAAALLALAAAALVRRARRTSRA